MHFGAAEAPATVLNLIKKAIKAVTPYGIVALRQRILSDRASERAGRWQKEFHSRRKTNIEAATVDRLADHRIVDPLNPAEMVDFLVARGIPRVHVLEGSIPEKSLSFLNKQLEYRLPIGRPMLGLHIGNFVGVSLAYLTAALCSRHFESLVVAVDPNVPHRGIPHPQDHVVALLAATGLQGHVINIVGYSATKSVSNDGVVYDEYDPAQHYSSEASCERVLRNLSGIMHRQFDIALLDGNHEAPYLMEELGTLRPLLSPRGIVILDDIDENWTDIRDVFLRSRSLGFEPLTSDGRIGVIAIS